MVARSLSFNDNDEITGLSGVFRQNRNILRATTGRPYEQIRKSSCSIKLGLWGMLEVCTKVLPLPTGEVPPEGRGRGMCRQWGAGCSFVCGVSAVGLLGWLGVGFFWGDGGKSGVGGLTGVGVCGRIGVQLKDCLIVKLMDRF